MVLMKVLLITNIPTPYRIPFFNEINQLITKNEGDFSVVFAANGYDRRKWIVEKEQFNFKYDVLENTEISGKTEENTSFTYKGVLKLILKEKPSHVIVSGFSRASLKVFFLSFFMNFKLILWTGSVPQQGQKESFLKKFYRKTLASRVKHFITYSEASKKYLTSLGTKEEKISVSLNTVDTSFFEDEVDQARKLIIPDEKLHLTYLGYLSKRKNVLALLEVFEKLLQKNSNLVLDIIGDGEEKENLVQFAKNIGIQDKVIFHGYKQRDELTSFFAQTAIFLYQTNFDIWGLVLNEAMASELCCVASVNAISTQELIEHGENGFAVNFNETQTVETFIQQLIDSEDLRLKFASNARKTVQRKASLKQSVSDFVNALEK